MDLSTIIALISVCGVIATIIGSYLGYKKGLKQEGAQEGGLRSDVGYIKAGVDELKIDFKEQRDHHYELAKKVVEIDASARSAHKRIDGLEHDIEQLAEKV